MDGAEGKKEERGGESEEAGEGVGSQEGSKHRSEEEGTTEEREAGNDQSEEEGGSGEESQTDGESAEGSEEKMEVEDVAKTTRSPGVGVGGKMEQGSDVKKEAGVGLNKKTAGGESIVGRRCSGSGATQ